MEKSEPRTRPYSDPLVSIQALSACRILVINGKGGSGKTTISTNLAAWFASRNQATALLDADPQSASSFWISRRSAELAPIYSVKIETSSRTTLSFQMRAPKSTRWLITDAPPSLTGPALDDLVRDHDLIIVPVMPSDIDARASARFIGELLLSANMRRKRRPIAVVANRIKQHTNAWPRLQKFLQSLNIPYPTILRDTQHYVRAYGEGRGIADYPQQSHERDRQDWAALLQWIDERYTEQQTAQAPTQDESTTTETIATQQLGDCI